MTRSRPTIAYALAAALAVGIAGCSSDDGSPANGSGATGGAGGSGGSGGSDAGTKPTFPKLLSEAGLYDDVATETLAPGVRFYQPSYLLWSDFAAKRRWLYLPPGAQIDTSDMDHWTFPEGTKAFKEFSRDGVRVETRMLHKAGPETRDWIMIAYLWNDAQSDADAVPLGMADAHGTPHDVPNTTDCALCHDRVPDVLAGVSAVQLSHNLEGVTLQTLMDEGALSAPPAGPLTVPGDPVSQAALGYLHANCGLCHHAKSDVQEKTDLELWLTAASLGSVDATTTYRTTVGIAPMIVVEGITATARVAPGDPDGSMLLLRMNRRLAPGTMPPLATEVVDEDAVADVSAWITALPP